jgi:P27 family predicted phage terminase small subunit
MGAGRKPLPTNVKIFRGNPGRRPLNDREPKPPPEIPPCPKLLQGEARREWKRITKTLHALGLLTKIDRAALVAYCQLWGRWIEAEDKVRLTGAVIEVGENGYPILNPHLSVATKTLDQMKAFLTEFGMTPASRSRIHVAKNAEEDEDAKFLG